MPRIDEPLAGHWDTTDPRPGLWFYPEGMLPCNVPAWRYQFYSTAYSHLSNPGILLNYAYFFPRWGGPIWGTWDAGATTTSVTYFRRWVQSAGLVQHFISVQIDPLLIRPEHAQYPWLWGETWTLYDRSYDPIAFTGNTDPETGLPYPDSIAGTLVPATHDALLGEF